MFMSVILSLPSLSFLYYIVSFFCEAIQYFRVYLSSSFLFTLLFVLIFWTVPKVYCTYWLTLHWYFMLEGNENLFINRIHINHCICKEKYAYRQKICYFNLFLGQLSTTRKYLLQNVFAIGNWLLSKKYFSFMNAD